MVPYVLTQLIQEARILVESESWRRERLHGADVIFQPGVSPEAEKAIAGELKHAYQILKARRFADAWGGTFVVVGKGYKVPAHGMYSWRRDETWLAKKVRKSTILHELGHRWWYKRMTRANRLRFIDWVKGGLSPVSTYAKEDPWEAFAEAFRYFVLGKPMTPQQVGTFKSVARGTF